MKNIFLLLTICVLLFIDKGFSQLNGTYTIGQGGNFPTFLSAVSELNSNGISGPVVFNFISGTYTEQVSINNIAGVSEINTITFQSQSGNASDVVIQFSPASTLIWVIRLNGVKYVTLQNLTIQSITNLDYRTVITLTGNVENIKIAGCVLNGLGGGTTANKAIINCSNSSILRNIHIEGNIFNNGTYGIRFNLLNPATGTIIKQNTFNSIEGQAGINLVRNQSAIISQNDINTTAINTEGIVLSGSNGPIRIIKNKIITQSHGIYINNCNGSTGDEGLIVNNFVSQPTGSGRGIWLTGGSRQNLIFNSVKTNSTAPSMTIFAYDSSISVFNNILINDGTGEAYQVGYGPFGSPPSVISDYNNLYSNGDYIAQWGCCTFKNIQDLHMESGQDGNSISKLVSFVSNTDLHLADSSVGDFDLTGIPIPGITDDIDGDLRHTIYPYMGADEGDIPLPVELASFTYSVAGNIVSLMWSTSTEINNYGFEVERNNNEQGWMKAGFVAGSGTTSEIRTYSFIDNQLASGSYEYRLKQIDFDGTFEYSDIVEVEVGVPDQFALFQNYPNPFNPTTKISWQSPVGSWQTVKVYDLLGREVAVLVDEERPAGYYEIDFDASSGNRRISSGVYIYTLKSGSYIDSKKMILAK